MNGCLPRVACAILLAFSYGCGGAGTTDPSAFAGKFEGTYLDVTNHAIRGPISASVNTKGDLVLTVDGTAHVGRVLPDGVVVGIPPIAGTFELNEPSIFFLLTRGKDGLIGYMDRVGVPPASRVRWRDLDVESKRYLAREGR